MTAFIAHLTAWDIGCIVVGSWTIFAVLVAPVIGRAMRHEDEVRQPDVRDWVCSDGFMRTAAEATDWCAAIPGSDAYWLDAWIFGEVVPDYMPQEWSA